MPQRLMARGRPENSIRDGSFYVKNRRWMMIEILVLVVLK